MKLIKQSAEVFIAPGPIAAISPVDIALLRAAVANSPRGRVRINLHQDSSAPLQEMFIAIKPGSYIRPHKHPGKSESFHLVYGEVDVVVFDDFGHITDVVALGAGNKAFYYRMSAPRYHTLLIYSELLIVHEITNGPFERNSTLFGSFAPEEEAVPSAISTWQQELYERVKARE